MHEEFPVSRRRDVLIRQTMANEQKKTISLLYKDAFSKSELFRVNSQPFDLIKDRKKLDNSKYLATKYHENSSTNEDANKFDSRGFAYLGVYGGISNCSKVIDFKKYGDGKVGRPKKPKPEPCIGLKPCNSRRHRRKGQPRRLNCNYSLAECSAKEGSLSLEEDIIERRRKSIKAKLSVKKEHLLTPNEEQDIHTRADIYAITTIPDPDFYITPDDDQNPRTISSIDEAHINSVFPAAKKKRRRNYGNSNCYVSYHNNEDIFDNTKMLPLGTRLIKPPTKLVELVAQAIHGSPDGLLQVQQIYTYLQNRYPFFRYMDKSSVNSWRSSIRHALYQKWFRKIRFDLACISCKGCYWAINHMIKPKEWTMPENSIWISAVTDDDNQPEGTLDIGSMTHSDILSLLRDEKSDGDITENILAAARDLGIEIEDSDLQEDPQGSDPPLHHEELPVRQSDPVLATCAPELLNEDVYLSNTESSVHSSTSSLLDSPLQGSIVHKVKDSSYNKHTNKRKQPPVSDQSVLSPVINWTPNWDEYGSYILSPQSISGPQNLFGVENGKQTLDRYNHRLEEHSRNLEAKENFKSIMSDLNTILSSSDSPNTCLSAMSEAGSEIEVIAEFPKLDQDLSDGMDLFVLNI